MTRAETLARHSSATRSARHRAGRHAQVEGPRHAHGGSGRSRHGARGGASAPWRAFVAAALAGAFAWGCVQFPQARDEAGRSVKRLAATVAERVEGKKPTQANLADEATSAKAPASLHPRDSGEQVQRLQTALTDAGYWVGPADGNYGDTTAQAVMAVQKAAGLERTGEANAATLAALKKGIHVKPRSKGDAIEVDKTRQLLLVVRGGKLTWTFNTSTGDGKTRVVDGVEHVAKTPSGEFTVSREVDGMDEGPLGTMWRPKYFTDDGVAVHGSPDVPGYPASHGCARLADDAVNMLWRENLMPVGSTVLVY